MYALINAVKGREVKQHHPICGNRSLNKALEQVLMLEAIRQKQNHQELMAGTSVGTPSPEIEGWKTE
jgi:hypothetical protein